MKKRLIEMIIMLLGIVLMIPSIVIYPFAYILFNINSINTIGNMLTYRSFTDKN